MSDGNFTAHVTAEVDTSKVDELVNKINEISNKSVQIKVNVDDSGVTKLTSTLNSLNGKNKVTVDTSGLSNADAKVKQMSTSLKQLEKFNLKIDTHGIDADLAKINSDIQSLDVQLGNGAGTEQLQNKLESIKESYKELELAQKQIANSADDTALSSSMERYQQDIQSVQNQIKELKADMSDLVTPLQQINLSNQIQSWLENNTKATKDAKEQLQEYVNTLNNMGDMSKGEFTQIQTGFKQITQEQTAAGNTGKSFLSQFEQSFSRIGQFTGIYRITSQIPRLFSDMFSNVVDVNSALIELRKVSDATDTELSDSFEHATESAKEYGTAISDVISSQADWARLGYSIPESEQLADVTALLQAVGDNMTQESSTEGLISVLRGFQYDASQAQDIVDIVNEVANNEPIDTSGLFDALERCASSLYAANNTLEESVALVTTANSVVQNPESVGKMLADVKDNYIG